MFTRKSLICQLAPAVLSQALLLMLANAQDDTVTVTDSPTTSSNTTTRETDGSDGSDNTGLSSYPSHTIESATTSFDSFNDNTDSTYIPSLVQVAESTPTKSRQTKDSSASPMIEKEITFSWSLSLSPDTPLSKEEEQLLIQSVRRKLNTDPNKQREVCKTSGQPIILQKIINPRKTTQLVRTPTKRKRAKLLHSVRTSVARDPHCSTDTNS
ncbi:NRAG8 protein [Elysia marginata]|uniref:NRAG8 protein n=1 Tax=Elysia marginata TaxID=1093978 RepID=A0AAV4H9S8_9GAST|nr:NRAG8 protein [Elysia marginata]